MKRYWILCLAATGLLAGCAKEEALAPTEGKTVIAVSSEQTKTVFGDLADGKRPLYWADGDQVAANGVTSEALSGVAARSTTASFTFPAVLETPYKVVYPASLWKDASTITLSQVIKLNEIPLVGEGSGAVTIQSPTAAIKVSLVKGTDEDKLRYIEVTSADARLSGDFACDFAAGTLTPAADPSEADRSLRVYLDLRLSATATSFIIPVPAGEYAFTVKVVDIQGHAMEKATSSAKTLVAGQITSFPELTFEPTSTVVGVDITSAEDMIAFAKAYNAGEYDRPVARVANDFNFDAETSAAFEATGGIGTNDNGSGGTNYFNGTFDGNGKTIGGYVGKAPLFAYTGGDGIVKDLNLDATCAVNVPAGASGQFGVLVGRHEGQLLDCTSAATLTFANGDATATQYYGGLVGRIYGGKVEGCTVSGDVKCTEASTWGAHIAYVGGLSGTLEDYGTITESHFTGHITLSDGSDWGGIANAKQYVYIGGIVASVSAGGEKGIHKVTDCTTGNGAFDIRGSFKCVVGGIAGYIGADNLVSGCTNGMAVGYRSNGARADTTPTYAAGIVGQSRGRLEHCINKGAISTVCQSTTIELGGIAGRAEGVISDCTNEQTGTVTRTNQANGKQSNRYIVMGGVVGNATGDLTLDQVSNAAGVTCNLPSAVANTTIRMGGVVGGSESGILTFKGCSNAGQVYVTDTSNSVQFDLTALGGILGSTKKDVTFEDCTNTGEVYCRYTKNADKAANGRRAYLGGMAGLVCNYTITGAAGPSKMDGVANARFWNCTNSGYIHNANYNNTTTLKGGEFDGGIVGCLIGSGAGSLTIEQCKTLYAEGAPVYVNRGVSGGIAGYVEKVDIKDCESRQEMQSHDNALGEGGIAGWMVSSSMSGCKVAASIGHTKQIGGLAYLVDGATSISDCRVEGVTITPNTTASNRTDPAVFVSNAAAGATITNCGASGTIDGAVITLASKFITTDGGAVVSGTYIIE